MSVDSLIRNLRNIIRQDQGVAGDGQRIEQLGWMLFLKLYDDQEKFYELRDSKSKSPIPEALRWRIGITKEFLKLSAMESEVIVDTKKKTY